MADIKYSEECTDKGNTAVSCTSVSKIFDFTIARNQSYVFRGEVEGQVTNIKAPILPEPFAPVPARPLNKGPSVNPVREDVYHCEESLKYDEQSQHKLVGTSGEFTVTVHGEGSSGMTLCFKK